MQIRTSLSSAGDPVTFSRIFRTLEPLMGDESYGLGGLRQFLQSASSLLLFPCQYMCPTESIYDTKYVYCNSNTCFLLHIVSYCHICINAYFKQCPQWICWIRNSQSIPSLVGV